MPTPYVVDPLKVRLFIDGQPVPGVYGKLEGKAVRLLEDGTIQVTHIYRNPVPGKRPTWMSVKVDVGQVSKRLPTAADLAYALTLKDVR
jgi:hypothetical protein